MRKVIKYSVIIPCYNAGAYVDGLYKMLSCPREDVEFIFVDDRSHDNTYFNLCNSAYKQDNYIVLQTERNSGPGVARTIAMQAAKGDYFMFCDADDEFDVKIFDVIDDFLTQHGDADMVVFPYYIERRGRRCLIDEYSPYKSGETLERSYIAADSGILWGRVLNSQIIRKHNLKMPDRISGEDKCFVVQFTVFANKIYKLQTPFYTYIMNSGSITHNKHIAEKQTTFEFLQPIYKKNFPDIEEKMFANNHMLSKMKEFYDSGKTVKYIRNWCKEQNKRYPEWIKHVDIKKQSIYRRAIYRAMYKSNSCMIKFIMGIRRLFY